MALRRPTRRFELPSRPRRRLPTALRANYCAAGSEEIQSRSRREIPSHHDRPRSHGRRPLHKEPAVSGGCFAQVGCSPPSVARRSRRSATSSTADTSVGVNTPRGWLFCRRRRARRAGLIVSHGHTSACESAARRTICRLRIPPSPTPWRRSLACHCSTSCTESRASGIAPMDSSPMALARLR